MKLNNMEKKEMMIIVRNYYFERKEIIIVSIKTRERPVTKAILMV